MRMGKGFDLKVLDWGRREKVTHLEQVRWDALRGCSQLFSREPLLVVVFLWKTVYRNGAVEMDLRNCLEPM